MISFFFFFFFFAQLPRGSTEIFISSLPLCPSTDIIYSFLSIIVLICVDASFSHPSATFRRTRSSLILGNATEISSHVFQPEKNDKKCSSPAKPSGLVLIRPMEFRSGLESRKTSTEAESKVQEEQVSAKRGGRSSAAPSTARGAKRSNRQNGPKVKNATSEKEICGGCRRISLTAS